MAPDRQRVAPRHSEEIMGVMDSFRAGHDLDVDLSDMHEDDRRRAIDVLSGFAYGLDANLQRTAKHLLTLEHL